MDRECLLTYTSLNLSGNLVTVCLLSSDFGLLNADIPLYQCKGISDAFEVKEMFSSPWYLSLGKKIFF